MPQWGLTEEMRAEKPWGLPPRWLAAGKVVTDPVHGDIYLNELEVAVLDSSPFQRLRRIRQLGHVHFVYPGATHSRFSHSLGTLRVVQDLFDVVLSQRDAPHPVRDLFSEWHINHRPHFWRLVAEAIVLGRLGALLHDIGHVPFGHAVEDDLGFLMPHDANEDRVDAYLRSLGDGLSHADQHELVGAMKADRLWESVRVLILSKQTGHLDETGRHYPAHEALRRIGAARKLPGGGAQPSGYPFVADMVGNTICADLVDYLRRDHLYTGLPAALGHRFMDGFYVVPRSPRVGVPGLPDGVSSIHYPERMALHIDRDKRERKDIISELLKYLRFRYELQERVYSHHAKTAADAMLGKMIGYWRDAEWLKLAAGQGGDATAHHLESGSGATRDSVAAALQSDLGAAGVELARELDVRADRRIELRMRWLGDDSLLELLAGWTEPPPDDEQQVEGGPSSTRPPNQHVGWGPPAVTSAAEAAALRAKTVAGELLSRRLYKRAAQAAGASAGARLYELFGDVSHRRALERDAARYAEVDESRVVLWLPDPRMRMKVAEVLVDHGAGIAPFDEHSRKAAGIYDDHRSLWTITVYVHPTVHNDQAEHWILARLAQTTGIEWDRHRPPAAESAEQWPLAEAARMSPDPPTPRELATLLSGTSAQVLYRATDEATFKDTQARFERELKGLRASSRRAGDSRDLAPPEP